MNPTSDSPQPAPTSGPVPTPQTVLATKPLSVRVIGLGGAGGNAVAHMANTDLRQLRPVVVHTSARILDTIQAPEKILLGAELTHGLGAGGEPSLGRAAAEHDAAILKSL